MNECLTQTRLHLWETELETSGDRKRELRYKDVLLGEESRG
jgi:hypothetical protein